MFDAPKTILFLSVGKLSFYVLSKLSVVHHPGSCAVTHVYTTWIPQVSLSLALYLVYTVPYSLGTLLFYLIAIPQFLFINWGRGGGGHWIRRGGRVISKLAGHILFTFEFSDH